MILFRSLRLSLRFVIPLAVAPAVLAYAVVPLVDRLTIRWFVRDLDIRSELVAGTLDEPLSQLLLERDRTRINALMLRAIRDERLLALGYCDGKGKLLYRTPTFPETLDCPSLISMEKGSDPVRLLPQGAVHVSIHPMELEGIRSGSLILVHDMSFAERRSADTRKYVIILFAVLSVVISLITVLVAHLSWRGWIEGVRAMLRGEGIVRPFSQQASSSELQPLVGDLRALLRTLDAERRFADSHQTEPIGQFFRSLVPISCIMSRW